MSDHIFNVLFLCTGNSARSIIAEAILNRVGAGRFKAFSAGSHPKGEVHPYALQLLKTLNHDTSFARSKDWQEFAVPGAPEMNFVFTVCDNAANEACPVWPGQPMTAHWGVPDPAAVEGTEAEKHLAFADTYRMLNNRISIFTSLPMNTARQAGAAEAPGRDRSQLAEGWLSLVAFDLSRRLVAEALVRLLLVATVVGSGIMADRLTDDVAVALLGNTLPTGAILVVLITILGPISGAHFNPAVTLVFALRREIEANAALAYIAAQLAGGIAGTFMAHAMFELPILQLSATVRTGTGQWIAEAVAAFGLVFTILASLRFRPMRSLACRALHHRRLLVHRLDILRQSGRRPRPRSVGYLRRHPPGRLARLHRRRISGGAARHGARGLAAGGAETGRTDESRQMTVTIYHNPECGTSRNTLAMIRQSGEEPEVIEI